MNGDAPMKTLVALGADPSSEAARRYVTQLVAGEAAVVLDFEGTPRKALRLIDLIRRGAIVTAACQCPDPADAEAFARNRLELSRTLAIAMHVAKCSVCAGWEPKLVRWQDEDDAEIDAVMRRMADVPNEGVPVSLARTAIAAQTTTNNYGGERAALDASLADRSCPVVQLKEWVAMVASRDVRMKKMAAADGAHSMRPPVFQCVPSAWRQPLGDCLADVWVVRHERDVYLRILAEGPLPDGLSLVRRGEPAVAFPLRALIDSDVQQRMLLTDLATGYWYRAGRLEDFATSLLTKSDGWIIRGKDHQILLSDGTEPSSSTDQECLDAIKLAAIGNWQQFLLRLTHIAAEPTAAFSFMVRFYLRYLFSSPACEPDRRRIGPKLANRLMEQAWLREEARLLANRGE